MTGNEAAPEEVIGDFVLRAGDPSLAKWTIPASPAKLEHKSSEAEINLGRTLFFDKRLSSNQDRSCMSMLSSANDAAIVDASVRLGHAIGMSVTAEGIETAEHAEALRKLGCNRGQGYYFSRPKAPADLNLDATLRSHAA